MFRHQKLLFIASFFPLYIFSSFFTQMFETPKWLFFCICVCLYLFFLSRKKELYTPSPRLFKWGIFGLFCMSVSLIISPHPQFSMLPILLYIGAWVLFFGMTSLFTLDLEKYWAQGFVATAVLLSLVSFVEPFFKLGVPFSTIGNSDFLATVLVIGFLFWFFYHTQFSKKPVFTLFIGSLLILGIFITQTKGNLIFIGLFYSWQLYQRKKWWLTGFCGLCSGLVLFTWFSSENWIHSIYGRLHIWLTSLVIIKQNMMGVGLFQYRFHYTSSLYQLFNSSSIQSLLGTYSDHVTNAHNLLLNTWVELGIFGGLWLLVGYVFLCQFMKQLTSKSPYFWILLFFVIKSMYTVTFPAVTNVILFSLILGLASLSRVQYPIQVSPLFSKILMGMLVVFLGFGVSITALDISLNKLEKALLTQQPLSQQKWLSYAKSSFYHHPQTRQFEMVWMYLNHSPQLPSHLDFLWETQKDINTIKLVADINLNLKRYDKSYTQYAFYHQAFPEHLYPLYRLALLELAQKNFQAAKNWSQLLLDTSPRITHPSHDFLKNEATFILNANEP